MRGFLFLFLLVVFSGHLRAQTDTLVWYEGVQLQAEDFRGKGEKQHFEIYYQFGFRFIKSAYGYLPVFRGRAVFDRKASTMGGRTTRDGLRYAQIVFDLYGLHVRELELQIFDMRQTDPRAYRDEGNIRVVLGKAEEELKEETARFEQQLANAFGKGEGADDVFSAWEGMIRDSLVNTPELAILDEEVSTLGVSIGAGRTSFLGKTRDYFTNATSLGVGFYLDTKKRSRFGVDMSIGTVRTLQRLQARGEWEDNLKVALINFDFFYGYRIPVGKTNVLIPSAGLGVNNFAPANDDKNDKRRLTGYSPVVGLGFNQLLAKWTSPSNGPSSLFCQAKVTCHPNNFVKNMGGPQLNFSLSFSIDTKQTRTRIVKVEN